MSKDSKQHPETANPKPPPRHKETSTQRRLVRNARSSYNIQASKISAATHRSERRSRELPRLKARGRDARLTTNNGNIDPCSSKTKENEKNRKDGKINEGRKVSRREKEKKKRPGRKMDMELTEPKTSSRMRATEGEYKFQEKHDAN